jgi:hypothetical protein
LSPVPTQSPLLETSDCFSDGFSGFNPSGYRIPPRLQGELNRPDFFSQRARSAETAGECGRTPLLFFRARFQNLALKKVRGVDRVEIRYRAGGVASRPSFSIAAGFTTDTLWRENERFFPERTDGDTHSHRMRPVRSGEQARRNSTAEVN